MSHSTISESEFADWKARLAEVAKSKYSHFPPRDTQIELVGPRPESFQGTREKKEQIKEILQVQTREIPWICVEDVEIRIDWLINDRERYESPHTPDLDNIQKPILDALCGPNGLIIDDCQVVSITASCIGGWIEGHNRFNVSLILPDIFFQNYGCILKDNLALVDIKNGLYVPADRRSPNHKTLIENFLLWNKTKNTDQDEESMMINRFFHKSRVMSFEQLSADDYLKTFVNR